MLICLYAYMICISYVFDNSSVMMFLGNNTLKSLEVTGNDFNLLSLQLRKNTVDSKIIIDPAIPLLGIYPEKTLI